MSFSKSKQKTSTTNTQTSKNINVQDVEGVTVGEVGGNFTFTSTDMNAIGEAHELARKSLDVGKALQSENLAFIGDFFSRAQASLGSTVTALNTIAREDSKSGDERIAEIAGSAQKQIILIVGIIAAAVVGFAIFRKA